MVNARSFRLCEQFENENIEPDKVKSRIIKRAFEEYATGTYTLKSLADFLADHGVVQKKGTPLAKVSVVKMLTNRAYLGFIKHRGEWHNGNFEPILSPTLFEAVQKVLTSRKKPRKSKVALPFAFTGFAKCGECGCAITAQYATNRFGTRYTYYRCTKKMASAHSRIRKKRYSPHNCKPCFNQCRFLFLKLKKWISRLLLGKMNQFLKRKCCPKFEREDSSKRRKTE